MIKEKIITLFITLFIFITSIMPCYAIPLNKTKSGLNTDGRGAITVGGGGDYNISDATADEKKEIDKKMTKFQSSILFVSGLATISMIAIFMKHCIKLGVLGTEHWVLKRNSIMALLWSGLAAALLSGMTLFFAISYNLFR